MGADGQYTRWFSKQRWVCMWTKAKARRCTCSVPYSQQTAGALETCPRAPRLGQIEMDGAAAQASHAMPMPMPARTVLYAAQRNAARLKRETYVRLPRYVPVLMDAVLYEWRRLQSCSPSPNPLGSGHPAPRCWRRHVQLQLSTLALPVRHRNWNPSRLCTWSGSRARVSSWFGSTRFGAQGPRERPVRLPPKTSRVHLHLAHLSPPIGQLTPWTRCS
jgi:hypothetical protein